MNKDGAVLLAVQNFIMTPVDKRLAPPHWCLAADARWTW